jgi:hypothetical protein
VEAFMTKKSMKCLALLASLTLLSAGMNYIFIGTAGGSWYFTEAASGLVA